MPPGHSQARERSEQPRDNAGAAVVLHCFQSWNGRHQLVLQRFAHGILRVSGSSVLWPKLSDVDVALILGSSGCRRTVLAVKTRPRTADPWYRSTQVGSH